MKINESLIILGADFKKRSALSHIAKVFDPLGLLSPVTIRGKILIQDLRREEIRDWDCTLPSNVQKKLYDYFSDISGGLVNFVLLVLIRN